MPKCHSRENAGLTEINPIAESIVVSGLHSCKVDTCCCVLCTEHWHSQEGAGAPQGANSKNFFGGGLNLGGGGVVCKVHLLREGKNSNLYVCCNILNKRTMNKKDSS